MEAVIMDMSSYELERDDANVGGYSNEVLCAGWVPALVLHQPHQERLAIPVDLAAVDVDAFLRKMYAFQR